MGEAHAQGPLRVLVADMCADRAVDLAAPSPPPDDRTRVPVDAADLAA
jgi:hypothetical protein